MAACLKNTTILRSAGRSVIKSSNAAHARCFSQVAGAASVKPSKFTKCLNPQEVDFLVIGGGIVGLAIARELKRRKPSSSIILLEKEVCV